MGKSPSGHSWQHELKRLQRDRAGTLMRRNTTQILRDQYGWARKGWKNLNPEARLSVLLCSLNTDQSSQHSQASRAGGRHYSPISLSLVQVLLNWTALDKNRLIFTTFLDLPLAHMLREWAHLWFTHFTTLYPRDTHAFYSTSKLCKTQTYVQLSDYPHECTKPEKRVRIQCTSSPKPQSLSPPCLKPFLLLR